MKIEILKYLVSTFIIHLLLVSCPTKKLSNFDIFFITTLLVFSFFIINNYYLIKEKFDDSEFLSQNIFKIFQNKSNTLKIKNNEKSKIKNLNNQKSKNINISKSDKMKIENFHNTTSNDVSKKSEIKIENFDNTSSIGNPDILKELKNRNVLNENNLDELINLCANKDKCMARLNTYLNDKLIDNKEFTELKIVFGLDNLDSIQDIYLQERIDRDNAYEIANAIKSNSKPILISTLNYLTAQNKLQNNDSQTILNKVKIDDNFSDGIVMLSNLVNDGKLTASQSKIINEKCSSNSIDSCSIYLNDLKNKEIINNNEATGILQAYNRPGINSFYDFENELENVSYKKGLGALDLNNNAGNIDFDEKLIDKSLEDQSIKPLDNRLTDVEVKDKTFEVDNDGKDNIVFDDNKTLSDIQKNIKDIKIDDQNYYSKTMKNDSYIEIQNIDINRNINKVEHDNDMRYSIYNNDNKYLGTFNDSFNNSFVDGQTYLATDKWKPEDNDLSKCNITEKCELCENDYDLDYVSVSNFNKNRKILPKDNINTDYITDKLNSGFG
tara:strand:- start:1977 stop:3635 length:1659 start_codon:yes stop_codon:yes gene_type:complete